MSRLGFKRIESRKYTSDTVKVKASLYYGFGNYMIHLVSYDEEGKVKNSFPPFPEDWEDYSLATLGGWFRIFGFKRREISELHARLILDKWFPSDHKRYENIINILNFKK